MNARQVFIFGISALMSCLTAHISAQSIFTYAGGGTADGRPATIVSIGPQGVVLDQNGNLFVADASNNQIRRIDGLTGVIETVAGSGTRGFSGDGGPALEASLDDVAGIALDAGGHLYFADSWNNRIRRVDLNEGTITTFAGNGESGFEGDGGPATEARLAFPTHITLDAAGNLYISDFGSARVRYVEAVTGIITTFAGNGDRTFSGDGGPATAASLDGPRGIALDSFGNLFIADSHHRRLRRVDRASGIIATVAGNGEDCFSGVDCFGGDGGPATMATLDVPTGIAIDASDNVYLCLDNRIRRIDSLTDVISTIAGDGTYGSSGDGGPATEATLYDPGWLAFDVSGRLHVSVVGQVRRIDPSSGIIVTVAGSGSWFGGDDGPASLALLKYPRGLALDSSGNLFIADTLGHRVRRVDSASGIMTTFAGTDRAGFNGDEIPATEASLSFPVGLAVDAKGNLFIADEYNHRVRRVDSTNGIISTIAGTDDWGFSGDGGRATEAALRSPHDVALDLRGNLYIADTSNNRVRQVNLGTGIITTFAGNGDEAFAGDGGPATEASFSHPVGLALDIDGNLYVVDDWDHRIRKVHVQTGIVTTVTGNGDEAFTGDGMSATEASLDQPRGVVLDPSGNLYIADTWNYRVRRVDSESTTITTIAGNGGVGFIGDGGGASEASLAGPSGVVLDGNGNLYIADGNNHRVRVLFKCRNVDVPDLTSPSDGSQGLSPLPTIEWSGAPGAFRFNVYVDTSNPPQRIVASDIETTSFPLSGLESLTTYYWKVVAKGDPFCEPFRTAESEVWSFTTTSSCDVPGGFEGASN